LIAVWIHVVHWKWQLVNAMMTVGGQTRGDVAVCLRKETTTMTNISLTSLLMRMMIMIMMLAVPWLPLLLLLLRGPMVMQTDYQRRRHRGFIATTWRVCCTLALLPFRFYASARLRQRQYVIRLSVSLCVYAYLRLGKCIPDLFTINFYTMSQNDTDIGRYSFDIYQPILIIFLVGMLLRE